jgi:sugar/nucleoside kinase (ribokinase family)
MSTCDDNPSQCDVLVLGEYFCDLIFTGLPEPPRLGADLFSQALDIVPGAAYILTTALHRLGVRARWMARLGNDLFSQFVLQEAQREGLDRSLFQVFDRPLRSVSASFSFVHDRGFISYWDAFPECHPEAVIAEQRPRWVVNTPFDCSPESRARIDFIHQNGGRVYVDCQYVTTTLDEPGLVDTLRMVDVFAPNQSEACQLTGEEEADKAAARLAEFCPLVVVKAGGHGAYAQSAGQAWHAPALQVQVVDTTGAGDSFNAGFLAALLQGEPVQTCLRYGNICGGLSVTRAGSASAAPTLEELKKYL